MRKPNKLPVITNFFKRKPNKLSVITNFPKRKPNKLPEEVTFEEYSLKYETDIMEMHVGAVQAGELALVIDDLIATGGTLCAAIRACGSACRGVCFVLLNYLS